MENLVVGLMGLGLTVLGIVLAYIWKSNSKLQREMLEGQKSMMEGQKSMMEGQKSMMEGQKSIIESQKSMMEGQKSIIEGQKSMMSALERIEKGQEEGFRIIAEMLLTQTKILERIEGKIK